MFVDIDLILPLAKSDILSIPVFHRFLTLEEINDILSISKKYNFIYTHTHEQHIILTYPMWMVPNY